MLVWCGVGDYWPLGRVVCGHVTLEEKEISLCDSI